MMSLAIGASFFLIALVLAPLEILVRRWRSPLHDHVRRWRMRMGNGEVRHDATDAAEVVTRASRPGIQPGAIPRSHMGSGA